MRTVALVGGDGAGKTTVARRLENSLPWPAKYLYMGPSVVSGNAALPTTRLARALKMSVYRRAVTSCDEARLADMESHEPERGTIWVLARLLNRLAEAWWRQLLSFSYRVRGYAVIYDRYFLFEAAHGKNEQVCRKNRLGHLEYWILDRFYPKPDLVLFMDAPPEVLYSRKGEGTLEHLAERREVVLEMGKRMPNFVVIDASRPLEEVCAEVTKRILSFHQSMEKMQSLLSKAGLLLGIDGQRRGAMEVYINKRKMMNWLWIILIALNSIGFAAKAINKLLGHKYDHFVRLIDVSEEANLTTWFSVELFSISAVLLLLIAMVKNSTGDRWARHWTWLSVIFFYLSIDDLAQLHEMTIKPLRATLHTSGLFYYAWVIVAIPLCLVIGLAYLKFVLSLPRSIRNRVIVAGTIFIGGNIFMEMIGGAYIDTRVGPVPLYPILTSLEELGKYVGLVMFISALGTYITSQMSSISWKFVSSSEPGTCVESEGTVSRENTVASV